MTGLRGVLVAALRRVARLGEGVTVAASHAAGGCLRRSELQAAIRDEWERFGRCCSPLTGGLLPWEAEFYGAHVRPGDAVLLIGCGAGRDLLPLVEAGHSVTGVDVAPEALESCRRLLVERGVSARLLLGAIEQVDLPDRYDAAVFSWYCYGYVPGRAHRIAALRHVAATLRPGGRILVSYVPRGPGGSGLPHACAALAARLTLNDWRPDRGDAFLLSVGLGTLHYEHRFRPGEAVAEATEAGLRVDFHEIGEEEGRLVLAL